MKGEFQKIKLVTILVAPTPWAQVRMQLTCQGMCLRSLLRKGEVEYLRGSEDLPDVRVKQKERDGEMNQEAEYYIVDW